MGLVINGFSIEIYDEKQTDNWHTEMIEGKYILHVYFSNDFHISTEIRDNMTTDDILSTYPFLKLKQEYKYQKDYYDE